MSADNVKLAATAMNEILAASTGLSETSRKTITYYALATHALPSLDTFPLLALVGQMGTGKSQTLKVICHFAYLPKELSLRSMTHATIRDAFSDCENGTAILEEADFAWRDRDNSFERMLSDRYQRRSAKSEHKVGAGEKNWAVLKQEYFGATVLHRRLPFADAALDGRTIVVRFRADHSRTYREYRDDDPIFKVAELADSTITLPPVEHFPGVAARIFNTHVPILAVAQLCGDEVYHVEMRESLLLATAELKEAQSAEMDGLVVRVIVQCVSESGEFKYLPLSNLAKLIFDTQRVSLLPRQVGGIARQLGFTVKNSHGQAVVVPTPATLLQACQECGYDDEFISDPREKVLNAPLSVERVDEERSPV